MKSAGVEDHLWVGGDSLFGYMWKGSYSKMKLGGRPSISKQTVVSYENALVVFEVNTTTGNVIRQFDVKRTYQRNATKVVEEVGDGVLKFIGLDGQKNKINEQVIPLESFQIGDRQKLSQVLSPKFLVKYLRGNKFVFSLSVKRNTHQKERG